MEKRKRLRKTIRMVLKNARRERLQKQNQNSEKLEIEQKHLKG